MVGLFMGALGDAPHTLFGVNDANFFAFNIYTTQNLVS